MKNSIFMIFKIGLAIFLLVLPLVTMFCLRYYVDWINSFPNIIKFLFVLLVIGILAIAISSIIKLKFFNTIFQKAWEKSEKSLELYNIRNKEEIKLICIDKKRYLDVNKKYTQLNSIKGFIFIIIDTAMIFLAINIKGEFNLIAFIFVLVLIVIVYNYFGRIITISPDGIKSVSLLKKQFIQWDCVKTIGISVTGSGRNNIDTFMLVYVSKKNIKRKQFLIRKDEEGIITFKFRAKMIHHIMSFWEKEIINLYNVKRWRKYISKNRENILDYDHSNKQS